MTIREAIDRADSLNMNQYSDELKIQWLSELDNRIYNDLILTHEDNPFEEMIFPYTEDTVTLIADPPYDVLYASYLEAKIDEANEETTRYANSATRYNSQYSDYAKWYNRKHMPISRRTPRCSCHR